jgi:hypothetical protein
VPLVLATGAGAEMRKAMGIAVFSGMLGVTFFGLLFTPVFYVTIRRAVEGRAPALEPSPEPAPEPEASVAPVATPSPADMEDVHV